MDTERYEDLIQTEAEELAEALFSASYYDLSSEQQGYIRARVIESLWPENVEKDSIAA